MAFHMASKSGLPTAGGTNQCGTTTQNDPLEEANKATDISDSNASEPGQQPGLSRPDGVEQSNGCTSYLHARSVITTTTLDERRWSEQGLLHVRCPTAPLRAASPSAPPCPHMQGRRRIWTVPYEEGVSVKTPHQYIC